MIRSNSYSALVSFCVARYPLQVRHKGFITVQATAVPSFPLLSGLEDLRKDSFHDYLFCYQKSLLRSQVSLVHRLQEVPNSTKQRLAP